MFLILGSGERGGGRGWTTAGTGVGGVSGWGIVGWGYKGDGAEVGATIDARIGYRFMKDMRGNEMKWTVSLGSGNGVRQEEDVPGFL